MIFKTLTITLLALFSLNPSYALEDCQDYYLRGENGYSYSFDCTNTERRTFLNDELTKINGSEGSITMYFDTGNSYTFNRAVVNGSSLALFYNNEILTLNVWQVNSQSVTGYITFNSDIVFDIRSANSPYTSVNKNGTENIENVYLPPRTTIKTFTKSFEVFLRFDFNITNGRYFSVKYDYQNSLTYVGSVNYNFDNLGISTNGDSYSFDLHRAIYQPNPLDYYVSLPTLTNIIYGTKGLEFINNYYILGANSIISGTYYLNYNNLASKFIDLEDGTSAYASADITFKCLNGEYYDHISLNVHQHVSNDYNLELWITYSNAYDVQIIYHVLFNGVEFVNQLSGDFSPYYTIEIVDTTYNLDVYRILTVVYLSYYSTPSIGFNGGEANVFDLLGSAFNSLAGILSIEIFPNITLGLLLTIPFMSLILFFVIGLFKR